MQIWTLRTKKGTVKVLRSYRGSASTEQYSGPRSEITVSKYKHGCQWSVFSYDQMVQGSHDWFILCQQKTEVRFSVPVGAKNEGKRETRRYCKYHAALAVAHYGAFARVVE